MFHVIIYIFIPKGSLVQAQIATMHDIDIRLHLLST